MGFLSEKLTGAAFRGDLKEVKRLLDGGADVNARGEDGYTPLHGATCWGHLDVVKFLVDRGADISARRNMSDGGLAE
ncbi:ankyrin repeat domain-containing protein [Candidatus Methanodesulfokora washburnensis]|jgi:ankyrin repeat protein|uniref:Ankyrin repeat domain-containing protein n=2 Tax=Candidatus Methanodesulfokora washburnensis TaxID=2478471 RepID=A0A429GFJ3_9CREN|nr:ankyrin repeat domain-containing protein [Candidatus Methanodesulfokores washburnensis]RSN72520.1 ankyrin repeat domain-containing protein [Candidatus Methanodesulfokores washburnensis]